MRITIRPKEADLPTVPPFVLSHGPTTPDYARHVIAANTNQVLGSGGKNFHSMAVGEGGMPVRDARERLYKLFN